MTQPVQEPTAGRSMASVQQRQRSLFRRPAPAGGGGPLDWICFQSEAGGTVASGVKTIDWNPGEVDSTTADFYLDPGDDTKMRFDRLGYYMVHLDILMSSQPTQTTSSFRVYTNLYTNGGASIGLGFGGMGIDFSGTVAHPEPVTFPGNNMFFSLYSDSHLPYYFQTFVLSQAFVTFSWQQVQVTVFRLGEDLATS